MKQGRDDSIIITVQYTTPPYISFHIEDMYRVELFTELFHPYLVSLLFIDLVSLHPVTFLMSFNLVNIIIAAKYYRHYMQIVV